MNLLKNAQRSLVQRIACLTLILASGLGTNAYALTQSFQEWADTLGIDMSVQYQATRVVTTEQGTFEFAEHRAPEKMLMDMNMEGMQAVLLVREDLSKSYVLMPSMGMYREMPMDKWSWSSRTSSSKPRTPPCSSYRQI